MHGLHVEHRHSTHKTLSRDLAECLMHMSPQGKVIVATDKPSALLSQVRKHWVRATYKVRVERSKTLKAERIQELSARLEELQGVSFSTKLPDEQPIADITFATAERLARIAPECQTLIVTYDFAKEKLYLMTAWMPRGGRVVVYE